MIIKWFPRSWIQIKSCESVIYIDPSYMCTYFKKCEKKIIFSIEEDDALPEVLTPKKYLDEKTVTKAILLEIGMEFEI